MSQVIPGAALNTSVNSLDMGITILWWQSFKIAPILLVIWSCWSFYKDYQKRSDFNCFQYTEHKRSNILMMKILVRVMMMTVEMLIWVMAMMTMIVWVMMMVKILVWVMMMVKTIGSGSSLEVVCLWRGYQAHDPPASMLRENFTCVIVIIVIIQISACVISTLLSFNLMLQQKVSRHMSLNAIG